MNLNEDKLRVLKITFYIYFICIFKWQKTYARPAFSLATKFENILRIPAWSEQFNIYDAIVSRSFQWNFYDSLMWFTGSPSRIRKNYLGVEHSIIGNSIGSFLLAEDINFCRYNNELYPKNSHTNEVQEHNWMKFPIKFSNLRLCSNCDWLSSNVLIAFYISINSIIIEDFVSTLIQKKW